jgi:hypothetical protein
MLVQVATDKSLAGTLIFGPAQAATVAVRITQAALPSNFFIISLRCAGAGATLVFLRM